MMLAPLRQNPRKTRRAQAITRPAPVGGWNARDSIDDMPATDALLMDNWIPKADSVDVRPGSAVFASSVGKIATFSRASTATYFDASGILQTAATNIPRYKSSYYSFVGVNYYTAPQLMVEAASTNYCLYNRDLTNAAWVKTNATVAKDQIGIDGVSNSCTRVTATANNATVLQTVTAPTGCYMAYFARRIAGTGKLHPTKDGTNFSVFGGNPTIGVWTYIGFATAGLNPTIGFNLQLSGDVWDIDCVQLESGGYLSPIFTTSASVTRAADTITYNGTSNATTTVGVVESLMVFSSGATNKMLGAANGCMYDVTNGGIALAPLASGLSNSRWQDVNFKDYLLMFNGTDTPKKYDGSSITDNSITGVTSANLIYPWVFKNRVFVIEKNTLSAWYLGTAALSGAATELDFSTIFTMGGKLAFGATWSRDGGSGADDFCVFGTDKGEVAVYQGTDPASATTWDLVGVYRIGAPIGQRPVFKISADLVIITVDGFVPLSKVLPIDRVGAEGMALSDKIRDAVNLATRSHGSKFGWQAIHYPKAAWGLFNVPIVEGSEQHQYVVNTITGAWCRFTGMNAACWAVFNDNLYFGTYSGLVYKADDEMGDEDANGNRQITTADIRTAFDYMGSKGQQKQFTMYRPLITSDGNPAVSASFDVDFSEGTPASITTSGTSGSEWDVAEWDEADWSSGNTIQSNWYSASGVGYCASLHLRAVTNSININLNSINYQFASGANVRELVFGQDEAVARWVSKRITSVNADFVNYVAIGVAKNGKLIAGVVYHNHFPDFKNIELSMAAESPLWATRDIIKALLQYPFIQLGCKRITTCTSARNKRALRFNYGIGFRREGVIRRGYGNHDMIICGMLRKEAERWLQTEKKEESNGEKPPSLPPAPDPVVVNAAQTASNKETALYNAALNRVDQYTPQGTLTYTKMADEAGLPKYRSDVVLSPEAQKQFDIEQRVGTATSELGEAQLGRLRDALSQKFTFEGLPKAPGVDDFSVDRDKITQSIIQRNSPQMQAARNALENKLVNQGIPRGSKAWQQAVDDLNRQENDFNLAAIGAGGSEQSRLYGLGTDARTRAIQEYTTQRNQPLNELSALLGQSQIQNPTFGAAPQAQAAPTDTSRAYESKYQGDLAAYNNNVATRNSAMGSLFGLGGQLGAAAIMSDIRLKENIRHTGFERGFPIYEFSYKADPDHITYRGVMAQDVIKVRPDAIVDDGNYLAVDYSKIGIEFGRVH